MFYDHYMGGASYFKIVSVFWGVDLVS